MGAPNILSVSVSVSCLGFDSDVIAGFDAVMTKAVKTYCCSYPLMLSKNEVMSCGRT